MPITITYDFSGATSNDTNHLRSAMERLGWRRIGGSVLRYTADNEDWLNHVIPSLMFFRSYVLKHNLKLQRFSVDAHSVALVDLSDIGLPLGLAPTDGKGTPMSTPTNQQSSLAGVQDFIDGCTRAAP